MLTLNATLIGQIIVFLLLLLFIYKVVIPMIAVPVNERFKRIADGLAAADVGQKQLAEANQQAAEIVREARERARLIDDQAQRRSQETVDAARQTATAEGARILAASQAEIASEAVQARDQLRREYGALVVQGASRLLGSAVDERAHGELINSLAAEIGRTGA